MTSAELCNGTFTAFSLDQPVYGVRPPTPFSQLDWGGP
ncbi:hypothetical protein PoMZ_09588 [Pyricularia oryzae]|uniref:Uncharacterized protein n=1 Tax=Pyricularia oryzae TaxID=318829 RepID=A0A4P7MV16_PYROR|nr:hypothetical protein PoMZ_09588 [Pyricularia oryzae]